MSTPAVSPDTNGAARERSPSSMSRDASRAIHCLDLLQRIEADGRLVATTFLEEREGGEYNDVVQAGELSTFLIDKFPQQPGTAQADVEALFKRVTKNINRKFISLHRFRSAIVALDDTSPLATELASHRARTAATRPRRRFSNPVKATTPMAAPTAQPDSQQPATNGHMSSSSTGGSGGGSRLPASPRVRYDLSPKGSPGFVLPKILQPGTPRRDSHDSSADVWPQDLSDGDVHDDHAGDSTDDEAVPVDADGSNGARDPVDKENADDTPDGPVVVPVDDGNGEGVGAGGSSVSNADTNVGSGDRDDNDVAPGEAEAAEGSHDGAADDSAAGAGADDAPTEDQDGGVEVTPASAPTTGATVDAANDSTTGAAQSEARPHQRVASEEAHMEGAAPLDATSEAASQPATAEPDDDGSPASPSPLPQFSPHTPTTSPATVLKFGSPPPMPPAARRRLLMSAGKKKSRVVHLPRIQERSQPRRTPSGFGFHISDDDEPEPPSAEQESDESKVGPTGSEEGPVVADADAPDATTHDPSQADESAGAGDGKVETQDGAVDPRASEDDGAGAEGGDMDSSSAAPAPADSTASVVATPSSQSVRQRAEVMSDSDDVDDESQRVPPGLASLQSPDAIAAAYKRAKYDDQEVHEARMLSELVLDPADDGIEEGSDSDGVAYKKRWGSATKRTRQLARGFAMQALARVVFHQAQHKIKDLDTRRAFRRWELATVDSQKQTLRLRELATQQENETLLQNDTDLRNRVKQLQESLAVAQLKHRTDEQTQRKLNDSIGTLQSQATKDAMVKDAYQARINDLETQLGHLEDLQVTMEGHVRGLQVSAASNERYSTEVLRLAHRIRDTQHQQLLQRAEDLEAQIAESRDHTQRCQSRLQQLAGMEESKGHSGAGSDAEAPRTMGGTLRLQATVEELTEELEELEASRRQEDDDVRSATDALQARVAELEAERVARYRSSNKPAPAKESDLAVAVGQHTQIAGKLQAAVTTLREATSSHVGVSSGSDDMTSGAGNAGDAADDAEGADAPVEGDIAEPGTVQGSGMDGEGDGTGAEGDDLDGGEVMSSPAMLDQDGVPTPQAIRVLRGRVQRLERELAAARAEEAKAVEEVAQCEDSLDEATQMVSKLQEELNSALKKNSGSGSSVGRLLTLFLLTAIVCLLIVLIMFVLFVSIETGCFCWSPQYVASHFNPIT